MIKIPTTQSQSAGFGMPTYGDAHVASTRALPTQGGVSVFAAASVRPALGTAVSDDRFTVELKDQFIGTGVVGTDALPGTSAWRPPS